MAFSGALNSTLGRKRYAIRTYGDAVNWLLSKYATHATMANAYQDVITMKQQDNEAPTAFGHRVKTQCDLLNGLFDIQNVKDVFITGLSDLVSLKPIGLTSVTTVTSRGTPPHSVPNHIVLASVANRLSAFMPLPTVTSKKTRSNIRPTPWTT